ARRAALPCLPEPVAGRFRRSARAGPARRGGGAHPHGRERRGGRGVSRGALRRLRALPPAVPGRDLAPLARPVHPAYRRRRHRHPHRRGTPRGGTAAALRRGAAAAARTRHRQRRGTVTLLFWFLAVLMIAAAAGIVLRPLLRRGPALTAPRDALVAAARERLAELERDLAAGTIEPRAAETARLELERDLLAAAGPDEPAPAAATASRVPAAATALVIAVF